MIRNVVFDMGGVLIRYDFFKVLHALRARSGRSCADHGRAVRLGRMGCSSTAGPSNRRRRSARSPRGSRRACTARSAKSSTTGMRARRPSTGWTRSSAVSGRPDTGSTCCPTLPKRSMPMRRACPATTAFNGLFFSADWHLLKPEIAIYRAFCDEFHLGRGRVRVHRRSEPQRRGRDTRRHAWPRIPRRGAPARRAGCDGRRAVGALCRRSVAAGKRQPGDCPAAVFPYPLPLRRGSAHSCACQGQSSPHAQGSSSIRTPACC